MSGMVDFALCVENADMDFFSIEVSNDEGHDSECYVRERDEKWIAFKREHGLLNHDFDLVRWFDLYLRLCANGII